MMQAIDEMAAHREGQDHLAPSKTVENRPAPVVTADEECALRKKMKCHKSLRHRAYEPVRNIAQLGADKAKAEAQAALLIKLVDKYPDMVDSPGLSGVGANAIRTKR